MTDPKPTWQHIKTITDGEPFHLNGVNIWDHNWESTGERIQIKDPQYGQDFSFEVYKISTGKINTIFAAGEFSNNVWGIYTKQ